MARLTPVPSEQAPPGADLRTRIHAHCPDLQQRFSELSRAVRDTHRTLDGRLIELVRLRIAFHNQCRSCMAMRYDLGMDDVLDDGTVCSLERPSEAPDLTEAERVALRYADLMATNHLAADDALFDDLRAHFTEAEIVELGYNCAICVGFGRLAATWDMVDDLPEHFRAAGPVTPWGAGDVIRG
jgi:alkylhydroperoxidase family enzyme